jgi:adenylate cyclase
MDGFSAEELATRAGVDLAQLRRLIELGVLSATSDGFRPPDIQLARIYLALDEAGIAPEQIAQLMSSGQWSNAWGDLIFPDPFSYSERTLDELAGDLNVPRSLVERFYSVWQLPLPSWDDHVRDDEAELLRVAAFMFEGVGRSEEGAIAAARLFSENLRRIAESQVRFFRTHVEEPMFASGMPMREAIDLVAGIGQGFLHEAERVIDILLTRHMEHYIVEDVISNLELSLERAGLAQRRPKRPPAIAFLDLTGYTSLTEREGDEVAAALAERLAEMVNGAASRTGGQVVKLLGDGVMFHFPDPAGAIRCGLDLVDEAPAQGLPRARVGVSSGPVIFRDGDYFGRTVNVAARVTDYARPGEVLVTADAVVEPAPDDVAFTEIGDVGLKGVATPVRLYQAGRS